GLGRRRAVGVAHGRRLRALCRADPRRQPLLLLRPRCDAPVPRARPVLQLRLSRRSRGGRLRPRRPRAERAGGLAPPPRGGTLLRTRAAAPSGGARRTPARGRRAGLGAAPADHRIRPAPLARGPRAPGGVARLAGPQRARDAAALGTRARAA